MAVQALTTTKNNGIVDLRPDKSARQMVHQLGQRADELWGTFADGLPMTSRQFDVLSAIKADAGCSQTDIVELTGIDRSTLADIVRRLSARKLVIRRRTKEDARMYAVTLTDAGRSALKDGQKVATKVERALLSGLDPAERYQMAALLRRLTGAPI